MMQQAGRATKRGATREREMVEWKGASSSSNQRGRRLGVGDTQGQRGVERPAAVVRAQWHEVGSLACHPGRAAYLLLPASHPVYTCTLLWQPSPRPQLTHQHNTRYTDWTAMQRPVDTHICPKPPHDPQPLPHPHAADGRTKQSLAMQAGHNLPHHTCAHHTRATHTYIRTQQVLGHAGHSREAAHLNEVSGLKVQCNVVQV